MDAQTERLFTKALRAAHLKGQRYAQRYALRKAFDESKVNRDKLGRFSEHEGHVERVISASEHHPVKLAYAAHAGPIYLSAAKAKTRAEFAETVKDMAKRMHAGTMREARTHVKQAADRFAGKHSTELKEHYGIPARAVRVAVADLRRATIDALDLHADRSDAASDIARWAKDGLSSRQELLERVREELLHHDAMHDVDLDIQASDLVDRLSDEDNRLDVFSEWYDQDDTPESRAALTEKLNRMGLPVGPPLEDESNLDFEDRVREPLYDLHTRAAEDILRRWRADVGLTESDGGPVAKSAQHAPKGGATIAGKEFAGGEFIPSEVMEQATEAEKAKLEEKNGNEGGEQQEWDGAIDQYEVAPDKGWHETDVANWDFWDEGERYEQEIRIESGAFTPPDSDDEIDVFRWASCQDGVPTDYGPWVADEDEAIAGGKEYAEDSHQEPPEPEDEDIDPDQVDGQKWQDCERIDADYVNEDGDEREVRLEEGTFTFAGEEHTCYRWIAEDGESGEWTLNKKQAIKGGKQYAFDSHVDPDQSFSPDHPHATAGALDDPDVKGRPNTSMPDATRPPIPDFSTAEALHDYSWGYDGELNAALRETGNPPPGDYGGNESGKPDRSGPEMFEELRDLFARTKAFGPPPKTVRRGVKVDADVRDQIAAAAEEAMGADGVITMPGFVSTSTGKGFDGKIQYEIAANHGIDMKPYSHYPDEDELLLNHNCQYRVQKVVRGGETVTIHLEQISTGA